MSDFEMMCAMYDNAGIEYNVLSEKISETVNLYATPNVSKAIELIAWTHDHVYGYHGCASYIAFDDSGKLLDVYTYSG